MNHLGTKTLETNRLILRKITQNDIEAAFKNWTSDEKVTEYLRWPTHLNISVTEFVLNGWIKSYEKKHYYQWAIVLKAINEPIGTIGVVGLKELLKATEVGYCIGSKWWNNGIVTEALTAIIHFLFNEVKVNRIESQHDPNNVNSGKVLLKCGFKYEGTLREADVNNKGIVDTAIYSLLASEYFGEQ